jgi:nitroreductase
MTAMTLEQAVRARRSVRGFLPKPVPQATLDSVFELARWAPSGTNIQPWQVYVASGATRDALREGFIERVRGGVPTNPDHPSTGGRLGEPWRTRRRECAKVLYDAMNIAWEDKEGRGRAGFRNFELFDAPHVAFLCMHESFGFQSAADVGMYAQTLMLSLTAHGLASCAQGTMRQYPDLVRQTFDLDPEVKVLFGISFGFEDTGAAANDARTTRAELSETVVFMG